MFNHAFAFVMSVIASEKREEKGATAVEYALVIGLVSILLVGAVALFEEPLADFIAGVNFG